MNKIFAALVVVLFSFSSAVFAADVVPAKPVTPATVAAKPAAAHQDVVNINTADAQALTKLKGIGSKKADAIVAWRKANGNFKTIDQLAEVKGIGAKTVDANRQNIRL